MSINLQVSNSLTQLAKNLCTNLQQQHNSVFTPHFLVTQTDGMNNWLKLQMAQKLGIAANYKFLKPNDLIQQVYHLFLPWGDAKPLSAHNQTWLLYKLLADVAFIKRYKTVSDYYNTQNSDKEIKRLALAEKVADLFDQYQIYRPQLIREWNQASTADLNNYDWQKHLWIKTKQLTGRQLLDKTLLSDFIYTALQNPQNQRKLNQNMPAVHLFGLSITTDYHLELFYKIGQYINVWFYIINPAPAVYWFEDRSEKQLAIFKNKSFNHDIQNQGNALLTNWGGIIKDTFGLLFKNEELLNAYETIGIEEPTADTLLHKIQQDIFNNALSTDRNTLNIVQILDGSITINSCFTPVREVEVLYNYLVQLVDNKSGEKFSAREIVVMVSDIDAYAPYIKAVFSNAPYKFPFTIADESLTADDTLTGALKAILSLNAQNFKAEEVIQLLDYSYIKNRFGIADLKLVRNLVKQANIRFGITGNLENESVFVSWQYGLQRIIYGICISGGEEYLDTQPSIFPLDLVEGSNATTAIRFCHFVQVLITTITQRDKNRDLNSWILYIENVLQNLIFEPNEETNEDYDLLIKQLAKYKELDGIVTETLSYDVFTHNLLKNLGTATRTSTFVAGGITFCSLIPMRSIPFKVVALLGLNFDKFPRKEKPISFNLMDKKQAGDRNVKENDKHLFLETLLSAQQYLYISYVGQSVKDNTVMPPSVLVDELVDYIQAACLDNSNIAKQLVIKHPLHSFSKKYDDQKLGFKNYLDDLKADTALTLNTAIQTQENDFSTINLDKMVAFLKNPFKGYYNNVLNVYYKTDDVLLPETELFDLDNLQKWGFKNDLLLMDDVQINTAQNKWVKTGQLPLKNMARVNLQAINKEVVEVKKLFFECVGNAIEQSQAIEISLNQSTIKGNIMGIYNDKLVVICWSKNERKYLLEAYIKYLAATAAGLNLNLHFISADSKAVFEGEKLSQQEAKIRLGQLIDLYKKGHEEILVFYADLKINLKKIGDSDTFLSLLKKQSESEYVDKYFLKVYEDHFFEGNFIFDEYLKNIELLLLPLVKFYPTHPFKTPK